MGKPVYDGYSGLRATATTKVVGTEPEPEAEETQAEETPAEETPAEDANDNAATEVTVTGGEGGWYTVTHADGSEEKVKGREKAYNAAGIDDPDADA